jgi:hypothetical protein
MSNTLNPEDILTVLTEIKEELPSLVGPDYWPEISESFYLKLDQLQHSTDELEYLQTSNELVNLIAHYPEARQRLQMAIQRLDLHHNILADLVSIAEQLALDADSVNKLRLEAAKLTESQVRLVIMKVGTEKAKSIKLKNLEFDFGEMTEIAVGIITTSNQIFGETNYLLVAAGILLIARAIIKAMTVEISEQEASVFWGFVQACDENKEANLLNILEHTNEERKKVGLEPLTENQIRNALYKLSSIESVEAIDHKSDTWRIIEKYMEKN